MIIVTYIVLEKLRFENVSRPHENENPVPEFLQFEGRFRNAVLVWKVVLTVVIKRRFEISPAQCRRCPSGVLSVQVHGLLVLRLARLRLAL